MPRGASAISNDAVSLRKAIMAGVTVRQGDEGGHHSDSNSDSDDDESLNNVLARLASRAHHAHPSPSLRGPGAAATSASASAGRVHPAFPISSSDESDSSPQSECVYSNTLH